mgnify:FL=1
MVGEEESKVVAPHTGPDEASTTGDNLGNVDSLKVSKPVDNNTGGTKLVVAPTNLDEISKHSLLNEGKLGAAMIVVAGLVLASSCVM